MRSCRNKIVLVLLVIAYLGLPAEDASGMREEVCAKLKAHLMREFTAIDGTERASVSWVKQNLGADDEQIRKVMMDIYNEATLAHKSAPDNDSRPLSRMRLEGVIRELGGCADDQAKGFLMNYAASKENDPNIRSEAVLSYLRAADAEETKNIMLRFLVGEERMDDHARSSIYIYARMIWGAASMEKKTAIFHALCEAAFVESPQWVFEECDSVLLLMDPTWRDASQRESMLRRQLSLPFSKYYTELKTQMEKEIERIEKVSADSINNTNLAVIAPQGFSRPTLGLLTNEVAGSDREDSGSEPETTVSDRSPGRYAFFGLLALLLFGFGTWRFMRM